MSLLNKPNDDDEVVGTSYNIGPPNEGTGTLDTGPLNTNQSHHKHHKGPPKTGPPTVKQKPVSLMEKVSILEYIRVY